VLTKDWQADRAGVLNRLERFLRGEAPEADDALDLPAAPTRSVGKAEVAVEAKSEPAAAAGPPVTKGLRMFEFVEGTSSKFWEIGVDGARTTVRFGRIGTPGQSLTKEFASPADAARDADRLVREKLAKGYKEKTQA
jgi:predicted DNA-binding WGR domain protein